MWHSHADEVDSGQLVPRYS
ncbi:hypothetical protein [Pseudomonas sp. HY13-MNA-CIBAN-0226]